jgi:hypothetical protein
MLIQPPKIVTGYILPELPKPEYKALRSLERAMQARNWEVVNVLIRLGVYLWQTENGRAMLRRLLQEFRTTAPCETKLPPWRQKRARDKPRQLGQIRRPLR